MKKQVKFRPQYIPAILAGEKTSMWRLFDEKNLQVGDELELLNWATGEKFGEAKVLSVRQKTLGTIKPEDYAGHEHYQNDALMYLHYQQMYGDAVGPETPVKVVRFKFQKI